MSLKVVCYAASFLAEAMIAWLYLEFLFARKRSVCIAAVFFTVGYVALYAISAWNSTTLNALAFFVVNYILILLNYQCSVRAAALHTGFLCFAMIGAELIVMLVMGLFGYEFVSFTYNVNVMVLLLILSKILYLGFSAIGSRLFSPHKHRQEEPRLMALLCSLPLFSAAAAILIAYYGMTSGISEQTSVMAAAIVLTLLIVDLIVLVLYNALQQANEEYLVLSLSIQKEQADAAYYKALQHQYENQRILIHDIRAHLAAISALARQTGADEIEQYVSGIDSSLTPSVHAKLCTSPVLNPLLLHWAGCCGQNGVAFHCDVRDIDFGFMDAPSITTLFGNLLSNALESAAQSQEKELDVSVCRNNAQSTIVISIVNSCDAAPVSNGQGGFHTRKKEPALHGVGLKSVERVVRRYHGVSTMYYDAEEKRFHHVLQFPIP